MKVKLRILRLTVLVGVVAVLSAFLVNAQVRFSLPRFSQLVFENPSSLGCTENDTILVIAPHCDDEVFGAGGFIYDALKKGARVYVVVMTNGEAFRLLFSRSSRAVELGYRRQMETLEALRVLGIPKENVFFLGYPDRGLALLWHEYWSKDTPYLSRLTQRAENFYVTSFRIGNPYCGESVVGDLEEILLLVRPTIILTASPFDTHPDHWATFNFTMYAIERLRLQDPFFGNTLVFWYLVHWHFWPHGSMTGKGVKLIPPRELLVPTVRWQFYFLSKDTIFAKDRAVRKYRSQSGGGYPLSFVRANELFVEAHSSKIPTLLREVALDGRFDDWEGGTLLFSSPEVRGSMARRPSKFPPLAVARDSENLYFALPSLPFESVTYTFHLYPITSLQDEETYLDVVVESASRKTITVSPSASRGSPLDVEYVFGRDGVEVAVPLGLIHRAPTVFFKMEVSLKKRIVLETVWKVLSF